MREGSFVGVVAETEWAAIQAAKTLKVTWSTPQTKLPANSDAVYDYLENTKSFMNRPVVNRGNPEQAFGASRQEIRSHLPLAVPDARHDCALLRRGRCARQQGYHLGCRHRARSTRASAWPICCVSLRIKIQVIYREASGCYGRLGTDDAAEDAVVMSRAVGKPVRVQWSREDEHGWEPKGPAQLLTVRAGVDASGKVIAWDFLDRSFPWTEATGIPLVTSRQLGLQADRTGHDERQRRWRGHLHL